MAHSTICIVSHTHLCRNPRVLKEALTLSDEGYKVTIVTCVYDDTLLQEDLQLIKNSPVKYLFYSDLRFKTLASVGQKSARKIALKMLANLGIETAGSLGYGWDSLKSFCSRNHFDLYIMHQEMPLLMGNFLLNKGKNVAFDLEDWYSEDLLPQARKNRPIKLLKKAERFALVTGRFCLTTSHAMADKLAKVYHCKYPQVIYNSFPFIKPTDGIGRFSEEVLKVFWFSQTIGPGRGLEDFIRLSESLHRPLAIHLQGTSSISYRQSLNAILPARHQLHFHDMIPNADLPERIKEFEVGLALEPLNPPNKNYTISNKFFQYLQAGLPVIATRTAGQIEAFEKYQPGLLINLPANTEDIEALNNWLNNAQALKNATDAAKRAALEYNWENESKALLTLVEKALNE